MTAKTDVWQGALYPALLRLEQEGSLAAEWRVFSPGEVP